MSGHLIGCVSTVKGIGKSHKLALVAFADSADDRTHIGFPGYEGVMAWASCSRSRAAELIRDLVEAGYLTKHRSASRGVRAEYVVFPKGCCALHRPVDEPTHDLDAIAAAAGVSADQARALLDALDARSDPAAPICPNDSDPCVGSCTESCTTAKGSENSDSLSVIGSENSDPINPTLPVTAATGPGSRTREANESRTGPRSLTPPPTTKPPLPPDAGGDQPHADQPPAGGAGCARHRTTAPNCRGCGTTNRQQKAAAAKAAAERRRQADAAAAAADRALRQASAQVDPDVRDSVIADIRGGLRAARKVADELDRLDTTHHTTFSKAATN